MAFHLLILGTGSRALSDRFNECGGTRVRSAHVEEEFDEDYQCLKAASRVVKGNLAGRVDAVLLTWDVNSSKSTSMFFSMTETFKTNRERVFVCIVNGNMDVVFERARGSCWEMQSALMFFADRFISSAESPGTALKTLLKRKLRGACIQIEILASDDFIRGAIARRNARKQLFSDASKDAFAKGVLEKRFRSRMDSTMKVMMSSDRVAV